MSMVFITTNREQNIIFGFSLDDFVERDSKCRYIIKIVDKLDLRELYARYSQQGAEAYEPKIMLSIWFLAYCEGITSTRKLERACRKDLDFIYISGNLRPDHTTLSRFMQRNMDLWEKYFLQIVQMARRMNVSNFKQIAIDGTKIRAKSSNKNSMREHKINRYLEVLREDIKQFKELVEKEDSLQKKEELSKKIEGLKEKSELLEKRKEELRERKQELHPRNRENHQINLQEPEAMMMDLAQGHGYASGYNGQISVDNKSGLIVSEDLVQERNDEQQFIRQYERVEENLGADKERKYIADSGYNSRKMTEYVKDNQIDAYLADAKLKNYKEESIEVIAREDKKLSRLDFKYDKVNDCYRCPNGNNLKFIKNGNNGAKYISEDCSQCPIIKQCLRKSEKLKRKTIYRDPREESAEIMRQKMQSKEGTEMLMLRQTTVEPVFGNIKENLGFRRFRRKGMKNAKGEFALFCIIHNINKLYRLVLLPLFEKIRGFLSKELLETILLQNN
jgi:transposase